MAGNIRKMIDTTIEKRSRGNQTLALTTKAKFILKGLDPDRFQSTSPDDPAVLEKVKTIAAEMGVSL
jgi:hypothetical protein